MKKIFVLFIIVIAGVMQLDAQQVQAANDLKQLINQSFGYFPKLKELEQNILVNQEKLNIVRLSEQPNVTGNVSYSYLGPVGEASFPISATQKQTIQFQPHNNYNGYVGVNYTLYDFGRIKANIEKARLDIEQSKHSVEAGKSQLASQIANIYYNIIYFKKASAIQDSVIQYLEQNRSLVESKFRNGDALKIDVLNIQVQIDIEKNRKVEYQSNLQKQLNLLAFTTGTSTATGNQFDFVTSITDAAEGVQTAAANNYDFVLAKDRVASAKADINIAKLQDKPSINLNGSTGLRNGYQPAIEDIRFNYLAGVSLNIPIYNGGRAKKQTKLAETVVKQNELAIETLNNTYKKDIEQALEDVRLNKERMGYMRTQVEQAKEASQLAANRFKNGVATNIEITTASTTTQRVAFQELQYQYQLCLAYVELARLTGVQYWQ